MLLKKKVFLFMMVFELKISSPFNNQTLSVLNMITYIRAHLPIVFFAI